MRRQAAERVSMVSQSTQPHSGRVLSAVDEGVPLFASHADRSAPRPASGGAPNLPMSVALGRIADAMAGGADNAMLLQEIALCSGRALGAEVALIRAISPDGQNFVVV